VTQHFQPDVYPKVDDEATVLVEYPSAIGIIEASWNWPFGRKDFEVYGDHGSAVATTGGGALRVTLPNDPDHSVTPDERPADEHDSISHLISVVRGGKPNALSSVANNIIVTEILESARESSKTHARVVLAHR